MNAHLHGAAVILICKTPDDLERGRKAIDVSLFAYSPSVMFCRVAVERIMVCED